MPLAAGLGFTVVIVGWLLVVFRLETLAAGLVSTGAAMLAAWIAWMTLRQKQVAELREIGRRRRERYITMFMQTEAYRESCIGTFYDVLNYDHYGQNPYGAKREKLPAVPAFMSDFAILSELEPATSRELYGLNRLIEDENERAFFWAQNGDEWSAMSHIQEASAFVALECDKLLGVFGREIAWEATPIRDHTRELLDREIGKRERRLARETEPEKNVFANLDEERAHAAEAHALGVKIHAEGIARNRAANGT